jgi:multidrug efflux pump subunit AcrA (membrane-fusion protein)
MAEDTPPPRRNGLHPTAHTTRGGGPGLHPIAHTTRGGGPGRRRWILVGAAAAIVLGVGVTWWYYSGRESTDDAQIEGHITQISARLSGTIIKVNVTDNESVAAGTILAQIDPHDYQVAVDRVGAELADAEANAAAAGTGVPVTAVSTRSDIRTATGALEEAEAGVTVADRQVEAAQAQLVAAQARMREQEATALKNAGRRTLEAARRERGDLAAAVRRSRGRGRSRARRGRCRDVGRRRGANSRGRRAAARRSGPGRGRTRAGRAPGREDGARAGGDHKSACGERRCPRQAGASDARSGRIEPRANVDQGAHFGNRQSQGR